MGVWIRGPLLVFDTEKKGIDICLLSHDVHVNIKLDTKSMPLSFRAVSHIPFLGSILWSPNSDSNYI